MIDNTKMENSNDRLLTVFLNEERAEIEKYLNSLYTDVFPPESFILHWRDYIGATFSKWAVFIVERLLPSGASIQDLGCGFGSFVFLAREAGFNAKGVELSSFEVEMAKMRLSRLRPQDDSGQVYICGDAYSVLENEKLFSEPVDAITLWNILEHFPDTRKLFALCHKTLVGGGGGGGGLLSGLIFLRGVRKRITSCRGTL
jgi:2-polyprenyl-3-methyl-5-hydroxy-6-metoxy-1,4-benzoquinol methylase